MRKDKQNSKLNEGNDEWNGFSYTISAEDLITGSKDRFCFSPNKFNTQKYNGVNND